MGFSTGVFSPLYSIDAPEVCPLKALRRAVALSAVLLAAAAHGREPAEPYGADFVREGASWEGVAPQRTALLLPPARAAGTDLPGAGSTAGEAPGEERLKALRSQVAALEAAAGPYAAGLDEPLRALGSALAEAGDFAAARAAYRRALHLLRVNDGLYGEAQKPVVAALLGLHRAAGDYAALDEQMPYLFRLYGNGQPPLTGLRLEAALAYQRWQREALRRDLPGDAEARLLALVQLGEDLVATAAADPAADWAARRALALSQLRNLYLLQDRVAPPPVEFIGAASADPFRRREMREVDPQLDRLEAMQRTAFSDGEALLEALLGNAPEPVDRADLLRRLGDWRQWHGRQRGARESYGEAARLLAAADREDLIAAAFGAPVELPDNGAFWLPAQRAPREPLPVVEARFDVSADGRARSVSGETVSGRDSAHIRVLRALRQVRFRPRMEDGEPVATEDLTRRYLVYD